MSHHKMCDMYGCHEFTRLWRTSAILRLWSGPPKDGRGRVRDQLPKHSWEPWNASPEARSFYARLEEQMKLDGINAVPVHVVVNPGLRMLCNGHHRVAIAVKLGLPRMLVTDCIRLSGKIMLESEDDFRVITA